MRISQGKMLFLPDKTDFIFKTDDRFIKYNRCSIKYAPNIE